jgi:hypothetical protein
MVYMVTYISMTSTKYPLRTRVDFVEVIHIPIDITE